MTADGIDRFLEMRAKFLVVGGYKSDWGAGQMARVWKNHEHAENEPTKAGALDNAIDLAAAHTKELSQRYGVRGDIIKSLTDESLQIFGSICSRWHDFLGLDSRQPPVWTKHSRGSSDAAVTETPMKRSAAQGGLTFRPYSTPANRSMTGSQSTYSIGAWTPRSQAMPRTQSTAGRQFMSRILVLGSPFILVS